MMAKRIHRYTHAPASEAKRILRLAGFHNCKLHKAIDDASRSCPLCAASGNPLPSKKASLSHVDQRFNCHLQADFTWVEIKGTKHVVLHAVDAGSGFLETLIVPARNSREMVSGLDRIWISRHGAPASFASDFEFDRKPMQSFLALHNIHRGPRPVRRHNKTGVVERKHRTLKALVQRLQAERSDTSDATILNRATFLSNVFECSKLLSSFEMARGYSPSLLGMPPTVVSEELFQAAREQAATRAIQRLLNGRTPSTIPSSVLKQGTPILYFYRSSKASEPVEWRPGTVVNTSAHRVKIRNKSGAKSFVAYEDVRLRPHSPLTRILMEGILESALESTALDIPIDESGTLTIDDSDGSPSTPNSDR